MSERVRLRTKRRKSHRGRRQARWNSLNKCFRLALRKFSPHIIANIPISDTPLMDFLLKGECVTPGPFVPYFLRTQEDIDNDPNYK